MTTDQTVRRASLRDIDIAILAGGLGTRIKGILGDTPKALATVGGHPFLAILLERLRRFEARRIVLCLGVGAPAIERYLAQARVQGLEIQTVVERAPLGTAGAVRLSADRLRTDPVLIMNGDSFMDADLCELVDHHRQSSMAGTILGCRMHDVGRYGSMQVEDAKIIRFAEKAPAAGSGVINAGVYVFSQGLVKQLLSSTGASLERDFLAALPPRTLGAYVATGEFIDIGTPESLADAARVLAPYLPR
jgi:NDP-sugar pyrophosphorylase family protein